MKEITGETFITLHRPWLNLPSDLLSSMISTAEETLESPYFPEELKPMTAMMYDDLLKERMHRN